MLYIVEITHTIEVYADSPVGAAELGRRTSTQPWAEPAIEARLARAEELDALVAEDPRWVPPGAGGLTVRQIRALSGLVERTRATVEGVAERLSGAPIKWGVRLVRGVHLYLEIGGLTPEGRAVRRQASILGEHGDAPRVEPDGWAAATAAQISGLLSDPGELREP